jgi:hypothetical protein
MITTTYRIGVALFALVGTLALGGGGCNVGNEGERCNPSLSHDECGAGLSCQQPKDCPENYCCPTSGTSSNAYCQSGCNGGQASICAAGGDADCWELEDGGEPPEAAADGTPD